jgi:5-methylcytosine-specific restriction endonuclease McrA
MPSKRKKKSAKQKAMDVADDLVTLVAKKQNPKCELCFAPTTVGHHFIFKSKSTALRYNPENFIGLCRNCHFALHNSETVYAGKIILRRGIDWLERINTIKNRTSVKADPQWYVSQGNYLRSLL